MRGRYNFIYGNSWGISFAIGPYLAGLIMDNYDSNLLWYACAVVGFISVLSFIWLHWRVHPNAAASAENPG
jgi:MFS family permease